MRAAWLTCLVAVCLAAVSCVTHAQGPGHVRFADHEPVWRVNDRHDIPRPRTRDFYKHTHYYDQDIIHVVTRALSLPVPVRAGNTNALDEVPDSTWFTNRIGRFSLTPAEVRRGPATGLDPMEHKPWRIVSTKVGGAETGFIIEDSAGTRYVLKFDTRGFPEQETGAHLVVNRILWAAGYNVPDDRLVHFWPDELQFGPKSSVADEFGNKRPMSQHDLDVRLAAVEREPGKPIRALTSRFVDGIPVGGFSDHGTRSDDPNDLVPHERLRELRGLLPIVAWLQHTDIKEGNTIDAWASDPGDPEVHYLVHYMIDFGKALGNMAVIDGVPSSGFAYGFDWAELFADLFSLGLRPRPWDCTGPSSLRGIGAFRSNGYDPGTYWPERAYRPFEFADRTDGFWGARIVMRFTEAQLRAAVDAAQFSDPRAAEYLVQTLAARQRETARFWFAKSTPADSFAVHESPAGVALCFVDLMLRYRLAPSAGARYTTRAYDFDGRRLAVGAASSPGAEPASFCTAPVARPAPHGGYIIFELAKRTTSGEAPHVFVHVTGERPHVIGIERR